MSSVVPVSGITHGWLMATPKGAEALQVPGAQLHHSPVPAERPSCSGAALAKARHHPVKHSQDHKEWRISCSTNLAFPEPSVATVLRGPFLKLWLGGEGQDHERQEEMTTAGLVPRPEQVTCTTASSCRGAMVAPHQQDKEKVFPCPTGC